MLLAADGLSIFLSAVFFVSTMSKLVDMRDFVKTVRQYRILPRRAGPAAAWAITGAEFAVCALLLTGQFTVAASILGLLLVSAFTLAILVALRRRETAYCACFGLLYRERVGRRTVARDVALALGFVALGLLAATQGAGDWWMRDDAAVTSHIGVGLRGAWAIVATLAAVALATSSVARPLRSRNAQPNLASDKS